jgi:hypothetical protein
MRNKKNPQDSNDSFRQVFDALVPFAEDLNDEDVQEILAAAGVDADAVIEKAYHSLQDVAGRRYLSQGKSVPTELREALRQMKPASPRERLQVETERARTAIRSIFDRVKENAAAIANAKASRPHLQPAFRNKKDLSEADRKQLTELQEELDRSDAASEE